MSKELQIRNSTVDFLVFTRDDDSLMNIIREGISVGITTIITNSQTSGIGYRYITYFANKIVFNCNDVNEYVNLFNRTDIFPDEVPGRCIVEADKRVLECQSYLAFDKLGKFFACICFLFHQFKNCFIREIEPEIGSRWIFDI